jgi:hypothetical protein
MKRGRKWPCKVCGRSIATTHVARHLQAHERNGVEVARIAAESRAVVRVMLLVESWPE